METDLISENLIRAKALALPRWTKRAIAVSADITLILFSVWLAYYLRVGDLLPLTRQTDEHYPLPAVFCSVALAIPIFFKFGLYKAVFRFFDLPAFLRIAYAGGVYAIIFAIVFTLFGVDGVPRTIGLIQPVVLIILVSVLRLAASVWLGNYFGSYVSGENRKRIIIYGAGAAGREIAMLLATTPDMTAVAFADDNVSIQRRQISGLPVFSPSEIQRLVTSMSIDEILLALPSIGRRRRYEILDSLRGANIPVRTLPSYNDLFKGRVTISDIRDLSIDEILGRDVVDPDPTLMKTDISGKAVLVTGAGGSIGSELCRQIISQSPSVLVMVEQSEFALYSIHAELTQMLEQYHVGNNDCLVPILCSVRHVEALRNILNQYQVETIYHAAAYKHVPLVEDNVIEGLSNNFLGTMNLARLASDCDVRKFVLISTDKAVRPTSIMGASKRLAEIALRSISSQRQTTNFAIVRFGNVLDSSGSVVPLFRHQIKLGGPITLTHEDVTRYFMTISEAAQLVIQAGALTPGRDKTVTDAPVYLLDMGKPVKILDLAIRMIELSGLTVFDDKDTPNGDIEIKVVGLRPGEKLHEELFIGTSALPTDHQKIHREVGDAISKEDFKSFTAGLSSCLEDRNVAGVRDAMLSWFPSLKHDNTNH